MLLISIIGIFALTALRKLIILDWRVCVCLGGEQGQGRGAGRGAPGGMRPGAGVLTLRTGWWAGGTPGEGGVTALGVGGGRSRVRRGRVARLHLLGLAPLVQMLSSASRWLLGSPTPLSSPGPPRVPQLPFPSGTATGIMLNSFHSTSGEEGAMRKIKVLLWTSAGSFLFEAFKWFWQGPDYSEPAAVLDPRVLAHARARTPRHTHTNTNRYTHPPPGWRSATPHEQPQHGDGAGPEAWDAPRRELNAQATHTVARPLPRSPLAMPLIPVTQHAWRSPGCGFSSWPTFGFKAFKWTWFFDWNQSYV